jgi:hypothetical protein
MKILICSDVRSNLRLFLRTFQEHLKEANCGRTFFLFSAKLPEAKLDTVFN